MKRQNGRNKRKGERKNEIKREERENGRNKKWKGERKN